MPSSGFTRSRASSARILAIGVHPYVTGAAHRIKYFEQLYDYINKHDGVVHWTGQQIYDWYSALVPKPARARGVEAYDGRGSAATLEGKATTTCV